MDLSLIWLSLGRMSRHGLFPIPIEDISAIRTAGRETKELVKQWHSDNMLYAVDRYVTSIFDSLSPQQLWEFLCPDLLHVFRHRLQRESIIGFSFPEPNLEFSRAVSDFRG